MNRLRIIVLALPAIGLFAGSQIVRAAGIDLNVNNGAAQLRYLEYDGRAGGFGKREMDVGLLFTTDSDYLAMFGAQVIAEAGSGSPGLEAGIGLKFFRARSDGNDAFSLALGGQVKYSLPPYQRVVLGTDAFYSPRVLTFMDATNFGYLDVYAGYEVVPQGLLYAGYRQVRADIENHGTIKVEEGGHIGLRFEF